MKRPVPLGYQQSFPIVVAELDFVVLELLELFDVVQLHLTDFSLLLFWDVNLLVFLPLSIGTDHYHAIVTGPEKHQQKRFHGVAKRNESTITRASFVRVLDQACRLDIFRATQG